MKIFLCVDDEDEAWCQTHHPDVDQIYALRPPQYMNLTDSRKRLISDVLTGEESEEICHDLFRRLNALSARFDTRPFNYVRCFKVYYWMILTEYQALVLALDKIRAQERKNIIFLWKPRAFQGHSHLTSINYASLLQLCLKPGQKTGFEHHDKFPSTPVTGVTPGAFDRTPRYRHRCVAFGHGTDVQLIIPDMLQLAASEKQKPLIVGDNVTERSDRAGQGYRPEYQAIDMIAWPDLINSYSCDPHAYRDEAHDQWDAVRQFLCHEFALSDDHRGEYLGAFERDYIALADLVGRMDRLCHDFQGSVFVVSHFNGLAERVLEQRARYHQIRLVARPHGWINHHEGMDYRSDEMRVSGPLLKDVMIRHLGLESQAISVMPEKIYQKNSWDHCRVFKRSQHHVLFLIPPIQRRILNEMDVPSFQQAWQRILSFVHEHPKQQFYCKAHIHAYMDSYSPWLKQEIRDRKLTNICYLQGKLDEVVQTMSVIIDVRPGTATKVSLLSGVPVILYQGMIKYYRGMNVLIHREARDCLCMNVEELLEQITQIIHNDVQTHLRLMTANRHVRELIYATDACPDNVMSEAHIQGVL